MIIDPMIGPYVVHSEAPLLTALQRITDNAERIVFCVDSSGVLQGSLTDGDFRRWIVANPAADLSVPALEVAHQGVLSAPRATPPGVLARMLSARITHVPLIDARGRLVAIALDRGGNLRIGRHDVGPGHPALVIAEIGNNHNGDPGLARDLVDLAVEAGADVVKFQLRDMDALYRQSGGNSAGEDLGAQYTLDLLRRFSLPASEMIKVFDHARSRDVEVMCTPWDIPSVDVLAAQGIPSLKIASADLTNHELLRAAAGHGLPLVMSTGMSREDEIRESVALLGSLDASFALLHCQSTYPAPYKDVNLAYMDRLAEIGDCIVGYSGHERGHHVPVAAVARGASIIEKHLTVDTSMEGNDHKVSLLPQEFATMVEQIRDVERAIGDTAPRTISTGEQMNRITLAKSLVAARDIPTGTAISDDDVAVRSPGRGLQPNRLPELLGRSVGRDLRAGDFFFEGDLAGETPRARQFVFDRPWGLPVRFHDWEDMVADCVPDFVEFHFSSADLDIEPSSVFTSRAAMGFTTHLPDLFSGDFLVDLASSDPRAWERSIAEVQRTIEVTRALVPWFTLDDDPIMVVTAGGFTRDRHLRPVERIPLYERISDALDRIDTSGVRIALQTMPPYPWLMGGQQYHNLFLDPQDTAEFSRATGIGLCLDVSHSKLAANHLGLAFSDVVETLAGETIHLHLVDATGVDGEGVQIGEGEVDWPAVSQQLNRLAPGVGFIPEIWQGHVNSGEGFWTALDRLEAWL